MALVAKNFQDIITFSRATQTGTYVNSNGYITNSSVLNYLTYSNQPENAAWTKSNSFVQQNLLLYSEDFTNVNWSTVNVAAPTANTTIAPDGTLTADTLTASAGLNTHNINQSTSVSLTPVTFSIYLKAGTHGFVQLFHGANSAYYANFNLSTGVLGTVGGSASATITAAPNGFYRCTLTVTPSAASALRVAFISSATAVYNESWTAAGTETVFPWGAQFVQGSVPGDYRATTSAALPVLYADYNGALRARKLSESTATGVHFIYQVAPSAGTFTYYQYVKAGERTRVALGNSSVGDYAVFDLSSGTIVSSGSGTVSGAAMINQGNGYYRCSIICTSATVWVAATVLISTGTTNNYTGDGSSGIYIADAQLNDGSSALAYYDTTASAYNAPRFDYDPVTLAAKGLLVEESRANLLLQSNDFQTSWANTNITRTLNSTLSPDGNVNGVKIAATAAVATTLFQAATVSATAATGSVYVKQGTGAAVANGFVLKNGTTATNLVAGALNFSTGVFTYSIGSTGVVVTNAGNGWWRVSITATSGITSGDSIQWFFGFTGGAQTAGDFLYAYGAQLEAGAFATSYIPTVASQVTRAADVASVNTLSPWFNSVAGTLYAEFDAYAGTTANRFYEFASDSNNVINGFLGPSTIYMEWVTTSTVNQAQLNAAGSPTQINKVGAAYKANDFAASLNGAAAVTDASGTVPVISTLYLGSNVFSGGQLCGHLRRITYYPRRMTNTELQTLTTL